ncbi:MAG: transcription elongation factor GreA [Tissierellia bacterium]|nr:transcription elongation factor GreA [Tissierellia bacterium]
MSEKEYLLTQEGYNQHEEELNFLRSVRRKEIAEKIKEARSFGDLSENAEYDEAKNEQAQVEDRILLLEHMLSNAKIIEDNGQKKDQVVIGSVVILKDLNNDEVSEYTIVGSAESNPLQGKISNESPVGSSVIGHSVGDKFDVETPSGVISYQLMDIKG